MPRMFGRERESQGDAHEADAGRRVDLVAKAKVHPDQIGRAKDMIRVAMFESGVGGDELDRGGLVFETPDPLRPGQVRIDLSATLTVASATRLLEEFQEGARLLGVPDQVKGERITASLTSVDSDGHEVHQKLDITPRK